MRARDLALTAAVLLFGAGCATTSAPEGWLPGAEEAQWNVHGGWAEVTMKTRELYEGELIAVHRDSVFILTEYRLVALPVTMVYEARVSGYDWSTSAFAAWTLLGMIGSLTNGFFSFLTIPLWIIGGTVATAVYSHASQESASMADRNWDGFRLYARYPQGIPAGLDRGRLSLTRHARSEDPAERPPRYPPSK